MNKPLPASRRAKSPAVRAFDTLVNLMTRLGTVMDPSTQTRWNQKVVDDAELEAAYRWDWLARKVVDVPAEDATREWRAWQAEEDQIELLETEERRLKVHSKLLHGLQMARLYGGAVLYMGVREDDARSELDPESVQQGELRFLHVLTRRQLSAGTLEDDVSNERFGEPREYTVSSSALGSQVVIHPSRLIRLIGNRAPDDASAGLQGWGDSILAAMEEPIKQFMTVSQSVTAMMGDAKVDVIRIPKLSASLATQKYQEALSTRFAYAAQAKSLFGFLLMDKEEEWQRIAQSFTEVPELLRTFMTTVSGAADIPATRLFGQSPQGLNATGDGDLQNYYDRLTSEQENELTPAIQPLDEVLIRSSLGDRPEEIYYDWNELYGMTEAQKSEVFVKNMTGVEKLVTNGLANEEALAEATQNMVVELGILPGFDQALEEYGAEAPITEEPEEPDPLLTGEMVPGQVPIEGEPAVAEGPRTAAAISRLKKAVGVDALRRRRKGSGRVRQPRVAVRDARPRTLYVRRDVLNGDEILRWARTQGFEETLPASELHVTLAFSRAPIDWMKAGEPFPSTSTKADGTMLVEPGGPRVVERLGRAVTLMFVSSWLTWRHQSIRHCGASWEWEDYQPHVTISYDDRIRIDRMEPYRGAIRLGPEIFEEVQEDWAKKLLNDKGWRA